MLTKRHNIPPWDSDIFAQLPLDKMAIISHAIYSCKFSLMKSFLIWLKFHWSLFLKVQLATIQNWFRHWFSAEYATNQCWPDSMTHICGTKGRKLIPCEHQGCRWFTSWCIRANNASSLTWVYSWSFHLGTNRITPNNWHGRRFSIVFFIGMAVFNFCFVI